MNVERPSHDECVAADQQEIEDLAANWNGEIDRHRTAMLQAQSDRDDAIAAVRARRAAHVREVDAQLAAEAAAACVPLVEAFARTGSREDAAALAVEELRRDAVHRHALGSFAGAGDAMAGRGIGLWLDFAQVAVMRDPAALPGVLMAMTHDTVVGGPLMPAEAATKAWRAFRTGDPASIVTAIEGVERSVAHAATHYRSVPVDDSMRIRWDAVIGSSTPARRGERLHEANAQIAEHMKASGGDYAGHVARIRRVRAGDTSAAAGMPSGWIEWARNLGDDRLFGARKER